MNKGLWWKRGSDLRNNMSFKVGITGGIGSGKTTVCRIFSVLGIPVFDADRETRTLMQTDRGLVAAIKNSFGEQAYDEHGMLDRAYLADLVFRDEAKLNELNSLVHPVAIQAAIDWAESQTAPYTLKEAALLFESGSYRLNDVNILVTAPEEERIRRVMLRDQVSRQQVLDRISKQMPEAQKMELADYVIDNSGQVAVIPQVLALHELFLKL